MSTFITKDDFKTIIDTARIDQITGNDDSILDDIELDAVAMIQEFLSDRFDMDAEFAKTGSDRNRALLRWTLSLATYYLYQRGPDKFIPEHVEKDYNDTLDILKKIINGQMATRLKRKREDTDGDGVKDSPKTRMRVGSHEVKSHNPYRPTQFTRNR